MTEEHNCFILASKSVPKLRYRDHAPKFKPLLHCTESLNVTILKYLVYREKMNINAEFIF